MPVVLPNTDKFLYTGAAVVCGAAYVTTKVVFPACLNGGKKVLQMERQANGQPRSDLHLFQKLAIKIAGYAIITFGTLVAIVSVGVAALASAEAGRTLTFPLRGTNLINIQLSFKQAAVATSGLGVAILGCRYIYDEIEKRLK